jgi:hypothetical protein
LSMRPKPTKGCRASWRRRYEVTGDWTEGFMARSQYPTAWALVQELDENISIKWL